MRSYQSNLWQWRLAHQESWVEEENKWDEQIKPEDSAKLNIWDIQIHAEWEERRIEDQIEIEKSQEKRIIKIAKVPIEATESKWKGRGWEQEIAGKKTN